MHDLSARTEHRVRRFHTALAKARFRATAPVEIASWEVPDEPVPFAEARDAQYQAFELGTAYGKPWGTTWFHVTGTVPAEWQVGDDAEAELVVDLGFNGSGPGFQAEAAVWTPEGALVKAIEPYNDYIPLSVESGSGFDFYLEVASNPSVAGDWVEPSPMGSKETAGSDPIYCLKRLEMGLRDVGVWELAQDVVALEGIMKELPTEYPRRAQILAALERMMDTVDPEHLDQTAAAGREVLAPVLAAPAHASAHRIHAVGHAHIDSAWLWPVRETVRKCARTFSNVLALMDTDPDVTFACSSAQQYAWIKQYYPELFERIRQRVADNRFIPVGGMWVESDSNMVGAEAFIRQFMTGTGFFMKEFGVEPKEVWLPDTFGYTAALPGIAKAVGKQFFLTQKISWNDTNRFPHHSFLWEGIDGSRVFTHFPPADTYNSDLSARDLMRGQRQYAEKGKANTSIALYGWGDGGGGPTREMAGSGRRFRDLEGAPQVEFSTSHDFFTTAAEEYVEPPVWSGEMYLEYHRGTLTSQHKTKSGNRRNEHLLREAELWAATDSVRNGTEYPYEQLERMWQTLLLHQFHDILPGSSIAWVHREAERNHAALSAELQETVEGSLRNLVGEGDQTWRANASPFAQSGVGGLAVAAGSGASEQSATLAPDGDGWVLSNGSVTARVDAKGLVTSLTSGDGGREAVAPDEPLGLLQVHRDKPNEWDAWDINSFYNHVTTDLDSPDQVTSFEGEGRVGVRVEHHYQESTIVETISLADDGVELQFVFDIDWHEHERLLKLRLPFDVHADRMASEIQFGHIERPTHTNTSWDEARFETCAHRWVRVAEAGYGVAVTNSETYGYAVGRHTREDGGTTTTIRPSLLRGPRFPDPDADQGQHHLEFAVVPDASTIQAVERGYARNLPAREVRGGHGVEPLVTVDNPSVVVEAVKLAEDRSGDVIVRLYEALGGRAEATVTAGFECKGVQVTDALERPIDGDAQVDAQGGGARIMLRPFEICTLRFAR